MRRQLIVVLGFVLLLRLPFLNQAIQLDDIYYLAAAQYAQTDPLHPNHASFVFLGERVGMIGHPHPPFNVLFLASLIFLSRGIHLIVFHAGYILFTLIAALGMLSLARRFTAHPLLATLLFLAVPALVVDGNSLMSDLPLAAWWLSGVAMFIKAVDERSSRRLYISAALIGLAGFTAYQAVLLIPILGFYLWLHRRDWRTAWLVLLAPLLTAGGYQLYERVTSGALPASVLMGHFQTYALQTLDKKLRNALALTAHAGWLLFPLLAVAAFRRVGRMAWIAVIVASGAAVFADANPLFWASFGVGVLILLWCALRLSRKADPDVRFLSVWAVVFFAGALIIFFAGAARYLIPLSVPVCLLAARELEARPRSLWAGFAIQAAFSLSLSTLNYVHWDGYRKFVNVARREEEKQVGRILVNGEWGLPYYLRALGGEPILRHQRLKPGDYIATTELGYPVPVETGGMRLVPVAEKVIQPRYPVRLMGIRAKSAYTTISFGLRPFDLSRGPVDVIRLERVVEQLPTLSVLPMNAPEAQEQIVSGLYGLESNAWRWMSGEATVLLKPPAAPSPLEIRFAIPDMAPGRRVSIDVNGNPVAQQTYPKAGGYTLLTDPVSASGSSVTITIRIDKTFSTPGDQRDLGMILSQVGFR